MRAMRLEAHKKAERKPLRLVELPTPEPAEGQALVRVAMCGVCHTDLHTVEGDIRPPMMPVTPGHQVVGVVEALGGGATNGIRVGQRVGVPWLYSACGECDYCLHKQENLCPEARFTGFNVDGGYAELMLAETAYLLPIPDSITDEQAAPLLCAGIIGYRSLKLAEVAPGDRVGMVGFGASAHLAIQVARKWGCTGYVFTRTEAHRQHARELGAAWTGEIEETPNRYLDRVVVFAPAGELVPRALEKLRPGGVVAINAIHMTEIPAMPYRLIYGERTLRSVANATYQDGIEFFRMAEEIGIRSTVSFYPLEEANQALQDLKGSKISGEAVLRVGGKQAGAGP